MHYNFPVVKNWLYLHKSDLLIKRSTQMMVNTMGFCRVPMCKPGRAHLCATPGRDVAFTAILGKTCQNL